MVQGVIRSLKPNYRKRVVQLLCGALYKGQPYPKVNCTSNVAFWDAVTQEPVMNCFKKTRIFSEAQHAAIFDSEYLFKELQESLDTLKPADPDMLTQGLSAEKVKVVDHGVISTAQKHFTFLNPPLF